MEEAKKLEEGLKNAQPGQVSALQQSIKQKYEEILEKDAGNQNVHSQLSSIYSQEGDGAQALYHADLAENSFLSKVEQSGWDIDTLGMSNSDYENALKSLSLQRVQLQFNLAQEDQTKYSDGIDTASFYLDIDDNSENERCRNAINHLKEITNYLNVLGSYKRLKEV